MALKPMKTSGAGLGLIIYFEGYRSTAYTCPAGVPTIGYGHTAGVKRGQQCTKQQAYEWLIEDVKKFEAYVNALPYMLTQNQFDALVSFTYNCGYGNLKSLTRDGHRDLNTIRRMMLEYNKANGKVLKGLQRRRHLEHQLFSLTYDDYAVDENGYDNVVTAVSVIRGQYDNSVTRKRLLALDGYNYDTVQRIVNILMK